MAQPPRPTDKLPDRRQPTVALALGGGGARGLAHILMLEALEEFHIRPTLIAGTSIGALFGAGFASGLRSADLKAQTLETLRGRLDLVRQIFAVRSQPVQRLLNLLPLRSALLDSNALLDLILPSSVPQTFEELSIPLTTVATDLGERESVVFANGAIRPAVAASIAIPVVFAPVVHQGRTLVDGGLVNPLPFDLVSGKADITIAIDVSGAARPAELGATPGMLEVMMQSVQLMEKSITREKLKSSRPDIYIDVDLDRFGALAFHKPTEILAASMPAKDDLRRQLERILSAETLPALDAPADASRIDAKERP